MESISGNPPKIELMAKNNGFLRNNYFEMREIFELL